MKKLLFPIVAIVAIAAIVVCFVFNGQKNDANKKLEEITAKLTDAEGLKDAAEKAKSELETKVSDLEAKVKELEDQISSAVKPDETKTAMTYEEYAAAELDSEVTLETYVQATQAWWDGKITVYAQSQDGAYFIYNMTCSEEDAKKLVPGTKIRVKGFKTEWSGEVEVAEGATFEILEGDTFIAQPEDVTAKLGTDELINDQNKLVAFKGMTVEAYDETGAAFAYKNAENKTDDLYFKVSKDGKTYDFCVEFYLCGQDTDVYKAVESLKVGDVIDMEGFLYWYNGANPHITKVTPAA